MKTEIIIWVVFSLVGILLIAILTIFVDWLTSIYSERMYAKAVLKYKDYTAENTGVGPAVTGGGGGVAITSSPEQYTFLLDVEGFDGVVSLEVSEKTFFEKEKGDKFTYSYKLGRILKNVYSEELKPQ